MNKNEAYYFHRMLSDERKGNPFSLNNPDILLVTHNVSYGFWQYGESDILAIDKNFYIYEGEIKVSMADFKRDFKKDISIFEERKAKLQGKYYIFPEEIYMQNEDKIFNILADFAKDHNDFCCGIVSVGEKIDFKYGSCMRNADPRKDYRIDLISLAKLIRLTCFRQIEWTQPEQNKQKELELFGEK